jgi:hypothetical protein
MDNVLIETRKEFSNFQTGKVRAVINNQAQARAAHAALISAGFTDDAIELYCGPEGSRDLDLKGDRSGFVHYLKRKFQQLLVTTRLLQVKNYERELQAGHCVIQVYTDFRSGRRAHEILRSNDGHFIHFYGLLTIRVLEP